MAAGNKGASMLVFSEQKLTFLATPKTGTTAIEMALRPLAEISFSKRRKHINASRYHSKVAPFLHQTFGIETETVAVMRAPADQLRSWYKYRTRPELDGAPRSTANISFDEFVAAAAGDQPPDFARVGSQFDFLANAKGEVLVNHLFAYENLSDFLGFLKERLETTIHLKRKNVSPPIDAPLSAEMETVLRTARSDEFALYDRLMTAGGYLHFETPNVARQTKG